MIFLKKAAVATIVTSIAAVTLPAQAATYYQCTLPTGCEEVKTKKTWSKATQTKYPVVMAHGLLGFTNLFGILEYFNGIPEALMSGGTDVYTTKTSAVNSDLVRGEQLLEQVQIITALTGKEKVNLFGHSQGGMDIRYVAGVAPELVASVTAVSSPVQGGAKLADFIINNENLVNDIEDVDSGIPQVDATNAGNILNAAFVFFGEFMDIGSGIAIDDIQDQNGFDNGITLSTDYIKKDFNVRFPAGVPSEYCGQPPANNNVNGILYYSFSGRKAFYNMFDPMDYFMAATGSVYEGEPNDGLVSVCSSRLGYVIRDNYRMNHLDAVNLLPGLGAIGEVNVKSVYRTQVNRLKRKGL